MVVTSLPQSLAALAERCPERGVVAIASDLLDLSERALSALGRLRARASQVLVIHVLHRHELELPFEGAQRFVGCEGEEPLEADADGLRDAYRRQVDRFVRQCRAACEGPRMRYVLAPTDEAPGDVLARLLRSRGEAGWG